MSGQTANKHTIEDFWELLFGDQNGYLVTFTGEQARRQREDARPNELADTKQRYWRYPNQAQEAAAYLRAESEAGRDAYFGVHLFKRAGNRKAENATEVLALWVDGDGAKVPEKWPEPTAVVKSSPGREHFYWRLTRPVDPEYAAQLSKRLAYGMDGDIGKWGLGTVLRVPGTRNFKRDTPHTVSGSFVQERMWEPEFIEQAIPSANGHASTTGHTKRSAEGPPVSLDRNGLQVWQGKRPVVKEGKVDRSGSLYKIGATLAEAGASSAEIETALAERDVSLGWCCYTKRNDATTQYANIANKVAEDKAPSANGHKKQGKKYEPPTHDELRDRWIAANRDHAHGLGDWRRYEEGIWPVVKTPVVKKSMVRVLEAAKIEGIKPSVFVVNSIHALAQFETYVSDELWDANPDILVAKNGTIDITSGALLPHAKEHYATSRVPYAYDKNAKAPNWNRFVEDLDNDVAMFLQEFAGYCLTTDTSYEKAVWLIGQPGGGKSTYLEGLLAMLGVRAGVLGLAEIEKSRFSLAKLEGKTLVTAAEQPAGYVASHHILNAIISGEKVQVERKHRDPYDLTPRAKIAWAMNELPRIPSGAEGLFRRVEVVKFPEIPIKKRDPTLKEGIKEEGAGILNWALAGLMRLRERGRFEVPAKIADATAQFREHNDPVGQFVEERCKTGKGLEEKSSELYSEYKLWCETTGHKAKNSTTIAQDWERLGFTKVKRKTGNYWEGVEVLEHSGWRGP